MITKDNIKQHTIVIALVSVLTYSVLILVSNYFVEYKIQNLQEVSKFSVKGVYFSISIIASIIASIYLMRWKPLIKFLLGEQYIAGKYTGSSKPPDDDTIKPHSETLLIRQTLISTSISGRSHKDQNSFTTWEGTLFKIENSSFMFAVSLATDPFEYGILSLQFLDDSFLGTYYSSNPVNHKIFIMKGRKSE